jgi:hypothetical protein
VSLLKRQVEMWKNYGKDLRNLITDNPANKDAGKVAAEARRT